MLVERHHGELYGFVVRFTGSSAAAEDVVQDAFLQVHVASASFDPQRKLKPWLFTIAANKARDYLRGRTRRREVPLDATLDGTDDPDSQRFFSLLTDNGATPLDRTQASETKERVRETVDQMAPALREVLVLAYFHRFAYKEIAEILSIPLGTVKSRLHSAVATFAKQFQDPENRSHREDV